VSKKILVIDDEADLRKMVVARLEKSGYTVIPATDGKTGLEKMRSENPDVVLLDLMMPGVDGYEVCRQKAGDPDLKKIPVILFTAIMSSKPLHEIAQELGADDYMAKPFDAKRLTEKVRNLIGD